jgi:hypothetical protein
VQLTRLTKSPSISIHKKESENSEMFKFIIGLLLSYFLLHHPNDELKNFQEEGKIHISLFKL